MRPRSTPLAFVLAVWLVVSANSARALEQTQTLTFPSAPAWYFVSLQVTPDATRPADVFPVANGFAYDHLWGYDPSDGWRHFSPDPDTLLVLNDLLEIAPLSGYWIHVTSVAPGGSQVQVSGQRVEVLSLEGAAFHASGALLPPDATPRDVATAFSELGPALGAVVERVFRHDAASDAFQEITQFSVADCGASSECLRPGEGYWIETSGDVVVGKEWTLSDECLILTSTTPVARLDLSYAGVGPAKGALRVAPGSGAGLAFFSTRNLAVDGVAFPTADTSAPGGSGPDAQADLGAGPEACLDTCAGAAECVDVCFANSASTHTLYVGMDLDVLLQQESYSSCTQGTPYATLELEIDGEVVEDVRVALKPPTLLGSFSGRLVYEEGAAGEVPLRLHLLDCPPDAETQTPLCGVGRAAALANPTLLAARNNAFDDDKDGDVDEPDEDGRIVHRRDAPSLPANAAFFGEFTAGAQQLRLVGRVPVSGLGFAAGSPEDGGAATLLAAATREVTLEGFRTDARRFAGLFSESYTGAAAVDVARGRFELIQIDAPQCIVPDALGQEAGALEIPCRVDGDCPTRCTGGSPEAEGFSCSDDSECDGGSCEAYPCAFLALGGASEQSVSHATAALELSFSGVGSVEGLLVELEGPVGTRVASASTGLSQQLALPALPCGPYDVRVQAANCRDAAPVVFQVDVCGASPAPLAVSCEPLDGGSPLPIELANPGATITLAPGFPLTTSARLTETGAQGTPVELIGVGGEPLLVGGDPVGTGWTSFFRWAAVSIRSGLLELD